MTWAHLRSSDKRYLSRPPANCKAARKAWDRHSKAGEVICLWLDDGYWNAQFANGEYADIDALEVRYGGA